MRKSVLSVCRRGMATLRAMLMPGLALLLALVPAAVVNMAMPAPVSAAIVQQRGDVTTGTTTNESLTIAKPAGVVAGDVMIVNIAGIGSNDTNPTSDGWILIDGADLGNAPPRYGAVLYRLASGTEAPSFTFALGGGTTSAVGSIVAFSGVDTSGTDPFDVVPGTISASLGKTTAVAAASIITASPDAAVIMFGMAANSTPTWDGWATTVDGTLSELYDVQADSTGKASVGAAWGTKTTAGTTGDGAATLSSSECNGGIIIALKPAVFTTLTVSQAITTYGETVDLMATLSPAVAGKTISFTLNGTAAGTADTDGSGAACIAGVALPGIAAGTYPAGIIANFAGDAGYCSCSGTASLTVRPRYVTVRAADAGKVYGDADPALAYQLTSGSLAAGDAFSGTVARVAGEDAGAYAIRRNTLDLGSNYVLTFVEGVFNIVPREITVKAHDSAKMIGEADPAFTYEITAGSLVAGDAFSGELEREAGENVGTYTIRQGSLALSKNYNVTFESGVFAITDSEGGGSLAPTISGISPKSGRPGDTFDVVISGTNLAGATKVDFGPGVTLNSFEVESSTRIVANVTIDPAASESENKVVVITPQGEAQLPEAFGIELPAATNRGSGLWLLLILLLLAIAAGFLIFAWFKRRGKRIDPELAPVLDPVRPMGGTREAALPAEPAPVDQPVGEAATAASTSLEEPEQATAAVADRPPEAMPEAAGVEVGPAAASAADQPQEVTESPAEPEQARAVAAESEPLEKAQETAEPEQAPVAAASEPAGEAEKTAGVPEAAAAAITPKPRRRATRKAATSSRPRTPAKKRKKATG